MKEYVESKILLQFDCVHLKDKIDIRKMDTDFILQESEHYDFKKGKREYYTVELVSCNTDKILVKYSVKAYSDYLSSYERFMINKYDSISKIDDWNDHSGSALKPRDILNLKKVIFEITYIEEKIKKNKKEKVTI